MSYFTLLFVSTYFLSPYYHVALKAFFLGLNARLILIKRSLLNPTWPWHTQLMTLFFTQMCMYHKFFIAFKFKKLLTIVLFSSQRTDFTASVYQKVNESLQSGVTFGWSTASNETHLALGCMYKVDDSFSWKVISRSSLIDINNLSRQSTSLDRVY